MIKHICDFCGKELFPAVYGGNRYCEVKFNVPKRIQLAGKAEDDDVEGIHSWEDQKREWELCTACRNEFAECINAFICKERKSVGEENE